MVERSNKQLHDEGVELAIKKLREGGIDLGNRYDLAMTSDGFVVTRLVDQYKIYGRIRRSKYVARHRWDVTLRSHSYNSTVETKAIYNRSWGSAYFYAFVDESQEQFTGFMYNRCLDVGIWYRRPELIHPKRDGNAEHRNRDGSRLISLDLRYQPPELVMFSSEPIPWRVGLLNRLAS